MLQQNATGTKSATGTLGYQGRIRSGTGGGSRTHMPLRAPDFESSASAIPPLRRVGNDMSRTIRRVQKITSSSRMTFKATLRGDRRCRAALAESEEARWE